MDPVLYFAWLAIAIPFALYATFAPIKAAK